MNRPSGAVSAQSDASSAKRCTSPSRRRTRTTNSAEDSSYTRSTITSRWPRGSASWNRREPEALPADSEQVWAEYRVWKAAQVNAAVRRRIEEVLADAQAVLRNMSDDADYLDSFGRGAASRRYESVTDCDSLLSASFYVSGSGGKSPRGYAHGQRVAWATMVARGLAGCLVDVTPAP